MLTKKLARFCAAAALTGFAMTAHAADTIELKLAHYLPTVHGLHAVFMEPWARELEQRTDGKVKVRVYAGNSSFGNAANQLDQVRAGVVDIAFGLAGMPRGRMPRTTLIEMPFLIKSADTGSKTLWEMYPDYLKDDYKGLHMLALMTHNGGLIHTRDKKVETIDDMKGLRIRTPSDTISKALTALGATPVGMPPGQVYESLQRGVIDGAAFPWDPVKGFKLDEVTNHHMDAGFYTASFWFAMNEKSYNKLPEDVRKAIDDISGTTLVNKFGGWWDEWDAAGRAAAEARGSSIVTLSDEARDKWSETLAPVVDEELAELEKQGVANAREIYDQMIKVSSELESQSQ